MVRNNRAARAFENSVHNMKFAYSDRPYKSWIL